MEILRKTGMYVLLIFIMLLPMHVFMLLSADVCMGQGAPTTVRQAIGIKDSPYDSFTEEECRACHNQDPDVTVNTTYLPDRHHLLVGDAIPTGSMVPNADADYNGEPDPYYDCLNCHSLIWNGNSWVMGDFRDCMLCHHTNTPHHRTVYALRVDCWFCHGELVVENNMRLNESGVMEPDPAKIPPGDPTLSDPSTPTIADCRLTCHGEGTSEEGIPVATNVNNHHGTGLFAEENCRWCHEQDVNAPDEVKFRTCENCHGPKSLHRIQVDTNGDGVVTMCGEGTPYFGHVGTLADDCYGCHKTRPADEGDCGPEEQSPSIAGLNPSSVWEGDDTTVTVTGEAFVETASEVILSDDAGAQTILTPTVLSSQSMEVVIPSSTLLGSYHVTATNNGTLQSNPAVLSVTPKPYVTFTNCDFDGVVVINGSGFGGYMDSSDSGTEVAGTVTTVNPKNGKVTTKTEIATVMNWFDDYILCEFSACPEEGSIVVHTVYTSLRGSSSSATCADYLTRQICNGFPECEWNRNQDICEEAGGEVDCGAFTDQASCEGGGCSWNNKKQQCR